MTRGDLLDLANLIKENLKKDFEQVHLSGNLANTITIGVSENGYYIDIPAQIYDIQKWLKQGVIVYTEDGSYAQQVNIDGGFSGKHVGYVELSIKKSIEQWIKEKNINVKELNVW